MSSNEEFAEALRKMREAFITKRSRQETLIAEWYKEAKEKYPEVLEEAGIIEELSLKKLIPELYEERPDKVVYEEQFRVANETMQRINSIIRKHNAEAMKELKDCLGENGELDGNVKASEIIQKLRETLIANRAKQEATVNEWSSHMALQDPDIFKEITFPADLTLRGLIPELYAENPRRKIYEEQYSKAQALFNQVNEVIDTYNKEAVQCLSEYLQKSSN